MTGKYNKLVEWKNSNHKNYLNYKFNINKKDKLYKKTMQIKFNFNRQDLVN
jgi:hypothetical protein